MTNLIPQLEAAGEGSRELSCCLARAIGWEPEEGSCYAGTSSPWAWCPDFTTSIDAAMSLVPAAWRLNMLTNRIVLKPHWIARLLCWNEEATSKAATPALALCIAALRARESLKAREAGEEG